MAMVTAAAASPSFVIAGDAGVGYSIKFAKGLLSALDHRWPHKFLANSELAQVGRTAAIHN